MASCFTSSFISQMAMQSYPSRTDGCGADNPGWKLAGLGVKKFFLVQGVGNEKFNGSNKVGIGFWSGAGVDGGHGYFLVDSDGSYQSAINRDGRKLDAQHQADHRN